MDIVISSVTQRTGSTLVQRIFNARKKTLIWGEQGGILGKFIEMRRDLMHFSKVSEQEKHAYFGTDENPNTWIANMTPDFPYIDAAIRESTRTLLHTLYSQHRVHHDRIGFKEVRYGKDEINLLKLCFPNILIILLIRSPIDVWRSEKRYWAGNIKQFASIWNQHADEYSLLHNEGNQIYLFRYEDITNREPNTLHVLSQLADISLDEINDVLSVRLNSTRRPRTNNEIQAIRQYCREGMKRYGYE
ncbi:sulfotransferase [Paenibacillus sp. N1-5-1-14]|uniref:sulfotransferase n=1 Tax=Paenibacillus radicibacter TaxID=2972488 RepID=UPI002159674F|nr:sulfotransferase [Paenibacillus radicibacter]MCR8644684.1 sulfotransferase [Paenibacillus radicibacter]